MSIPIRHEWNQWSGYAPARFRRSPARPLRPVKGGRWMVRKHRTSQLYDGVARPWRAWTAGSAKRYSRYFETQEEAVAWAHAVAAAFAVGDPDNAEYLRQQLSIARAGEKVSYA